ncbi:MAG: DEAD/DEAH box helicase [Dehalococcoidia bacterium]|nr:ATP-dependent RNA helicase DbpA [Chloroflexota bacterium]MBT9159112.1 ATP-dependent RNA helicase DbpA [Chloroflexota bacterium]MBT9161953.1 ATP-dependent RNA helicase DbpA [Chloroflexota bacterium]
MNASAFLDHLRKLPFYQDQIVHREYIPPREARHQELQKPLQPALQAVLEVLHLFPLYSHQVATLDAARSGKNVILSTPSASGKTLSYNLAVFDALLEEKGSRALYLFPTKALAQDQLRVLNELTAAAQLKVRKATFDGDTPWNERAEIRRSAQIVLSNPDMMHLGILPNHRSWTGFLSRLRYVVIDEAHVYRGVFGSHVANVVRRLRRICDRYGSTPQFICCSATIANPQEHAERLTGLPFEAITEDGAAFGGKDFIFWNPPLIDEARSVRRSSTTEATHLLTELMSAGIRSLAFARTRKLVELIYIYVRDHLAAKAPELAGRIKPYRAGYLAEARREIERELFEGKHLGVVATTALELGVDIGHLDATVLTGYPGSIASTWQQAGRSGRGRGEGSLSILIGSENPLDQYFMRHPEALFGKGFEHALIAPANPHILKPHLVCAAWESPLSQRDRRYFGDFEEVLEKDGLLRMRGRRWYPATTVASPAQEVNIRSTSSTNYALIDASTGELLETIESATAFFQIHPGAVYLHQGEAYLVTELDLKSHTAYAEPTDAAYYTQTKDITDLNIVKTTAEKTILQTRICLGEVEVTTQVLGFKKKRVYSEEVIGEEPLDLPPQSFATVAVWFDIPSRIQARIARQGLDLAGGLHAAEHASIAMLPLFALCDRNDIGGVSTPLHPDTGKAQIFIYDAHPGGVGIAEKGFELVAELWRETAKLIAECPCEEGCPSCVQSPKCGNNNQPLDKEAARVIFQKLLS